MQIYDVSLSISAEIPVWPGDPKNVITQYASIGPDSVSNNSRVEISVHTGTHVDAPYHFLIHGQTIDKISLKILIGRAYVLHLPDIDEITALVLQRANIPPRTRRLLIKTRNSHLWKKGVEEFQTNYVSIQGDGARYLVEKGIKLVGIDYLSVSPYNNPQETHEILLKSGVVILEGLNLHDVSQGRYMLYCLPLKLEGADGAPARTILMGV